MKSPSPFVPEVDCRVSGAPSGALHGLSFAVKDLFDVAGFPTGGGNPDWADSNAVPSANAALVQRLLDAGADLVGKTITDEVSLGILGDSPFFGTPPNPAAPGRYPGGSSSGSASAVAAGLCDTALGTDTGGSVRVPASFCGLYGIRPTHGRLNLAGMMAQAPSSDTAGWFARDAQTFARVSAVMLAEEIPAPEFRSLVVAVDAFGLADAPARAALLAVVERIGAAFDAVVEKTLAPPGLSVWARAQRTIQPMEAYQTFAAWLDTKNPRLAFSVAANLAQAAATPPAELKWANLMREEARARMRFLLRDGTVLCLPTTPFVAPRLGLSVTEQAPLRDRITCLCCHGGLTGVCQVSIPAAQADGAPIGLSLVAAPGRDAELVALACAVGP